MFTPLSMFVFISSVHRSRRVCVCVGSRRVEKV